MPYQTSDKFGLTNRLITYGLNNRLISLFLPTVSSDGLGKTSTGRVSAQKYE